MRVQFLSGRTRTIKIGTQLPFQDPIVKAIWTTSDIGPNPQAFVAYMNAEVYPRMATNNYTFSCECKEIPKVGSELIGIVPSE